METNMNVNASMAIKEESAMKVGVHTLNLLCLEIINYRVFNENICKEQIKKFDSFVPFKR